MVDVESLPVLHHGREIGRAQSRSGALRVARKIVKEPFEEHTASGPFDRLDGWGHTIGQAWFVGVKLAGH